MTNGNDVTRYGISPEQVDALFARSNEQAQADLEARQRAVEWPGVVEKALLKLFRGSATHDDALAAIGGSLAAMEARLGKLEAAAKKA